MRGRVALLAVALVACAGSPAPARSLAVDNVAADDVDAAPADEPHVIQLGRALQTMLGCVACHPIDGAGGGVGPAWAGSFGTSVRLADGTTVLFDEAYIRASILTPQAQARPGYPPVMPSFADHVTPQYLDALVAYIVSLR